MVGSSFRRRRLRDTDGIAPTAANARSRRRHQTSGTERHRSRAQSLVITPAVAALCGNWSRALAEAVRARATYPVRLCPFPARAVGCANQLRGAAGCNGDALCRASLDLRDLAALERRGNGRSPAYSRGWRVVDWGNGHRRATTVAGALLALWVNGERADPRFWGTTSYHCGGHQCGSRSGRQLWPSR